VSTPKSGTKGFELKSKVKGTALGIALKDISVSLEAGATPQLITGEATFGWANKTQLDVTLASRWLDLDQLAHTSDSGMPLEAARGYFEILAAALPAASDTNALLEFDQLTLGGEPVSNVRLAASRSGGPLELKGVRADLPGGVRLDLDGILTPTAKVPELDGTLFISGKSLVRFLAHYRAQETFNDLERPQVIARFVGSASFVPLRIIKVRCVMIDTANRKAEKMINLSHPHRIAPRKVIVDSHDMYAAACNGVKRNRQRRYERLPLSGTHLGDLSLVEHHAAEQLHVEMPLAGGTLGCFAHHRKNMRQYFIEIFLRFVGCRSVFADLRANFLIGHFFVLRLERVYFLHHVRKIP